MARRPKPIHQMTARDFERLFPDEESCKAYLVYRRWPNGVRCPRCGAANPTELPDNLWHWQCYQCAPQTSYRFSHIAGTIFENTNKPLRDWFRVIHLMLTSKKGMSALQIMRFMGFGSYKTAWLMCHKVRTALVEKNMDKLGGVVEVDETFVGGDDRNRHWDKKTHSPTKGKVTVIGAIKRKGNVVARVIENTKKETIENFVRETVSNRVSLLCTDAYRSYNRLKFRYNHGSVDHNAGEHVVGAIHTNTIEGFWSLIKRGIMGSYHKVSRKYLPLYVAEFSFRYNNRENPDIFGTAISAC